MRCVGRVRVWVYVLGVNYAWVVAVLELLNFCDSIWFTSM